MKRDLDYAVLPTPAKRTKRSPVVSQVTIFDFISATKHDTITSVGLFRDITKMLSHRDHISLMSTSHDWLALYVASFKNDGVASDHELETQLRNIRQEIVPNITVRDQHFLRHWPRLLTNLMQRLMSRVVSNERYDQFMQHCVVLRATLSKNEIIELLNEEQWKRLADAPHDTVYKIDPSDTEQLDATFYRRIALIVPPNAPRKLPKKMSRIL